MQHTHSGTQVMEGHVTFAQVLFPLRATIQSCEANQFTCGNKKSLKKGQADGRGGVR